jgi:glycine cleavage system H protein
MVSHDLTTMYGAKAVEYLIAASYLLLFIPFWRFVNGGPAAARERAVATVPGRPGLLSDWFTLPDQLFFHPGHAWARVEGPDTVTVGIDDFAGKLVGRVAAVSLPRVGTSLTQGDKGWSLVSNAKSIDMLSPVDGTVIAVNDRVASSPDALNQSPYERGWLMKVKSPRLATNLLHLLSGSVARAWMNGVAESLRRQFGPAQGLGLVYEDGGVPVDGIAHGLDPEHWDAVARRFLRTEEGGFHA